MSYLWELCLVYAFAFIFIVSQFVAIAISFSAECLNYKIYLLEFNISSSPAGVVFYDLKLFSCYFSLDSVIFLHSRFVYYNSYYFLLIIQLSKVSPSGKNEPPLLKIAGNGDLDHLQKCLGEMLNEENMANTKIDFNQECVTKDSANDFLDVAEEEQLEPRKYFISNIGSYLCSENSYWFFLVFLIKNFSWYSFVSLMYL